MELTYLHDEDGEAIAFQADDGTVWSPSLRFIGWFPWSNEPTFVGNQDGRYVGEIVDGRLCRRRDAPYVSDPGRRSEPLTPQVLWGPAPRVGRTMLAPGYEDLPRDLVR